MSLLFVYGTLRRDSGHAASRFLASHGVYVGRASVAGRLYHLGWHPGMRAASADQDRVFGDLYRVDHDLFRPLDDYEGPGWQRRRVPATLDGGDEIQAWVYLFAGMTHGRRRIWSGEWVTTSSGR